MRQVNMHQAKTALSQLVSAAEAGEVVVIARYGRPVVQLLPVRSKGKGIRFGTLKGMFRRVAKNFDAPLPKAVLDSFYGSGAEP